MGLTLNKETNVIRLKIKKIRKAPVALSRIRLCELLSCENCPVVIFKLDSRSCNDKCISQSSCAGELNNWIKMSPDNKITV